MKRDFARAVQYYSHLCSGISRVGHSWEVSKSHKFKGLVKVSEGVIKVHFEQIMAGGVSGQPEKKPGYATAL